MVKDSRKKLTGSSRNNSQRPGSAGRPSLTIYWNRVYQKTRTDMKRLREYGLPPETPIFRIVQCEREKGTLYGDIDRRQDSGELTDLVRDIIEGRPPEDYSPTLPILTEPSPFFLRTRGRLKSIERSSLKGQMTADDIGDRMTVLNANAPPSDELIEAVASLLLDIVMREDEETRASKR